ncbi:STAS domain-containing protein [uncultured Nostoc sp.]|uniref:slr1659 superfamily regulator n=1 Tax=uncultured Nostoc sp. TaxID=340711 RepID=UPI0035C9CE02
MVAMQDVKGEDYTVYIEPDTSTVHFQGELSLDGPTEYAPIANLLNKVVQTEPNTMTLDLRNLGFVNSSGISMFYKFVLSMQNKKGVQLVVLGSNDMPWQGKSLKNLEKLLPGLKLDIQ